MPIWARELQIVMLQGSHSCPFSSSFAVASLPTPLLSPHNLSRISCCSYDVKANLLTA